MTVHVVPDDEPLHLLVVGGGLCGLAAAIATRLGSRHRVTLLEAVAEFREVGAGLQVTPNGTRLLRAWGVTEALREHAVAPEYFRMRRFDGALLAERTQYSDEVATRHGAPLWCLHRADLHAALTARARELGVAVELGCRVVGIREDDDDTSKSESEGAEGHFTACNGAGKVTVMVEGGRELRCDMVLAADGVWSECRRHLLGADLKPRPTGNLAYRILLDRERVVDSKLGDWLRAPGINIWVGPGKHAVGYSIKNGRWLNLVLLVNDDLPDDVMKAKGDLSEMKAIFQGWDPILTQFLDHVETVDKWRLNYLEPLPFWKSKSGRFLLAGDCAHPMLPYMAQGANSSLEDGATIGALLSKVQRRDQIAAAVAMYDAIRRPRVDQLVQETFKQGKEHHLPDGPEQMKRDLLLSKSFDTPKTGEHGTW